MVFEKPRRSFWEKAFLRSNEEGGGKKGGTESAEHDIFNMHRLERNKTVREFSAFFECIMPAVCDKIEIMWPRKIMSTRQECSVRIHLGLGIKLCKEVE